MTDIKLKINQEENTKSKCWIGIRHYQCLLMFVTLLIFFGIRTSLSVAIICMTDESPPNPNIPTYPKWDNTDLILSSFFVGYIIPQVAAGQLSEYFGPKWFLVVTMIIGSIFHIAIPAMAEVLGSTGVIICRVLQGLNQGFLYPSIANLISNWTPLFERSTISNFVFGGAILGIAISMPLTGAISGSEWGWPVAFYVYGGLGIVWAIIFGIFAENSPNTHKTISEEEKILISSSNAVTNTKKKVPTPWGSILTSLRFYAILVAGIGQCWGGFTLLTEIPSYMSSILKSDINSNSQLSALPYVVQFIIGLIASPFLDKFIANKALKITTARKIAQSIASFVPAAALTSLAFLETFDENLVIVLLIFAVGASSFQQSGYIINAVDIAPNHSGTVFGICNGINNIFSILGPLTVGLLGKDKTDPVLWKKVFLLASGIYIACGTFYVIFASGEVQEWNDDKKEEESKKKISIIS